MTAGLSFCSVSQTRSKVKQEPRGLAVSWLSRGAAAAGRTGRIQKMHLSEDMLLPCNCSPCKSFEAPPQHKNIHIKHVLLIPGEGRSVTSALDGLCSLCPHRQGPLPAAGWAWGQRGHRCKKLLAPFSITTLPQGRSWCWGAHPAPSACRLCLGTVRREIREVFSLSPTSAQSCRDQRLLRLLDGAVSPGLPPPLHIPHRQISRWPHAEPFPRGWGVYRSPRAKGDFLLLLFPVLIQKWFHAAARPWLLAPRGEVQRAGAG